MAGIGFELKKLFHRRGLMAMLRAYGYAGVICAGPMLLGVLLQFGVLIVSSWWQVAPRPRSARMHDHLHAACLVGVDEFSVDAGHPFSGGYVV